MKSSSASLSMALVVVTIFVPKSTLADDMLPSWTKSVYLHNPQSSDVKFFLYRGSDWELFEMPAGQKSVFQENRITVAVPTIASDEEVVIQPERLVADLEVPIVKGQHFIRNLQKGERWYFCYSLAQKRWVIQKRSENLC